jgi:hypothetical protein
VAFCLMGTTRGYQMERLFAGVCGQHRFDAVAYIEPASADLDARQ